MLGKLLKYELKATARYFLPLFLGVILFTVFNRLYGMILADGPGWIYGLLITMTVLLMITLAVMTFVVTISRFYRNLLGNEGYLMFTLPVSTHHNIIAKLLAAMIWNISSVIVVFISIMVLVVPGDELAMMIREILEILSQTWRWPAGINPIALSIEWLLILLFSTAGSLLFLYLAMAIGQTFNEHKFLASVGAYLVLSFIVQTLAMIVTFAMGNAFWDRIGDWLFSMTEAQGIQILTLLVGLGTMIYGGICYFITYRLLHKKLNLA